MCEVYHVRTFGLQFLVPRHSLNVTVENVSWASSVVLVLIHAQMAVMKRDVMSFQSQQLNIIYNRVVPLILLCA